MEKKKLICIVGPTASGKTGMGIALAKKCNGEIVSADSRQIFRGLDIGTGKDLVEYGSIRYNLIDICEPGEDFTMFDWLDKAKTVLDDIWFRGKTPIVVGGTGLYVKSLVEGFHIEKSEFLISNIKLYPKSQIINETDNKQYPRQFLESLAREQLQEILIDLDEEAFLSVDLNNPVRVIRAIEKAQSGERVTKNKPDFDYVLIGRDLSREELYSRIDKRVEEWFEMGFYEEVDALLSSGVTLKWLNRVGLEYRILGNYISNKSHPEPLESAGEGSSIKKGSLGSLQNVLVARDDNEFKEMKQQMKYAIHQYARRQLTWWRRFKIEWVNDSESAEKIIHNFLNV